MTIVLTPETEAKLREVAKRGGGDPDTLANTLLQTSLERELVLLDDETAADLGEGLAAIDAGREKSYGQYLREREARRGISHCDPPVILRETEPAVIEFE